ncbi:hypothetical protein PCASD_00366 [Puccinia coronata f. sp. avenae]|uniref:60S acidic ribosomal protein P1 n=1 Tax=Puccinia coronata f. sp. avenae TaxID=200324 RepID=A0A2N5TGV0_9BASI|nr:hypothetical protein PCASD_05230 [Puccinia coronata f. sp. avenae]PLW51529.1 hypothetical protein PCASD_00366 [Puccinia coronata f. sp. avenae]
MIPARTAPSLGSGGTCSSPLPQPILPAPMAAAELASTYAALILADEGLEITADKITILLNAAKVEVEPIWATLLAKALAGKDVKDMLSNVGAGGGGAAAPAAAVAAGPGAEAAAPKAEEKKKEEEKEESDDDMGFGLFDSPAKLIGAPRHVKW